MISDLPDKRCHAQVPPRLNTAHLMPAVLLISDMVASLAGLRSSSFAAQQQAMWSWRASHIIAVAPTTSRRRR